MSKKSNLFVVLFFSGIMTAFAGIFPGISKPNSPDASLIALRFSVHDGGELTKFLNTNWSMWTPVVKKEDGTLVEFRSWSGGADITTIYYKENLAPGKYTLVGFNYVYTDYGKLADYERKIGHREMVHKNPYDNKPYHVVQFFPLKTPYTFTLAPNTMMSIGHYVIEYQLYEGFSGSSDDRYRAAEDGTRIIKADTADQYVLRYMKSWATKKWKMWNKKNPAKPLDD